MSLLVTGFGGSLSWDTKSGKKNTGSRLSVTLEDVNMINHDARDLQVFQQTRGQAHNHGGAFGMIPLNLPCPLTNLPSLLICFHVKNVKHAASASGL